MSNKKGILIYLAFTFGAAYALEALLRMLGHGLLTLGERNVFQHLVVIALLFIPALGAIIARRADPGEDIAQPVLWPVPWGKALRILLLVFLLFGIVHGITAAFGWSDPQWRLGTVTAPILITQPDLPSDIAALIPLLAYLFLPPITLLLGATLLAVIALGGEWGWRAYLLPRLEPLGRFRAHIATGFLWGAWLLPLFYMQHADTERTGEFGQFLPLYFAMMIILSTIAGEITHRTRHIGLAAIFIGAFLGQCVGIWIYLFQLPTPPWAGPFGIVSILVWCAAALVPGLFTSKAEEVLD